MPAPTGNMSGIKHYRKSGCKMLKPITTDFWGKYLSKTGETLSLLSHALDVAVVFRALCELDAIRRTLNYSSEVSLTDEHLDRLAVLAMLHDIGKANLGFQDKILPDHPVHIGHIRELAPLFSDEGLADKFMASLPQGIETWFAAPSSADSYFFAIFSHHGRPVRFLESKSGSYWQARDKWWQPDNGRDPIRAIAEISLFAKKAFPGAFGNSTSPLPGRAAFHHRFAGLLMLADWLGSHNGWFPIQEVTAEERLKHNRTIVPELLRAIGMEPAPYRPVLAEIGGTFQSQFGKSPLPMQKVLDKLRPDDPDTNLLVVESETGSGKTEAALNWFCKLFIAAKVDSLYFALPTRVAARELYTRINNYICSWFPNPDCRPVTLLAVPGYARMDDRYVKELMPEAGEANLWHEEPDILRLERYWAGARPKRFLAATVAVGTIDQALLSIVQTAHAHLRSACLDRSLLVVDEVHASDLYMSRLLRSLLTHHLGLGGHAMLLSATLGSQALNEYIKITSPGSATPYFSAATKVPYPSVTLSSGEVKDTTPTGQPKPVHFDLRQWAFCPEEAVAQVLLPALRAGARVLVVMNTVARAIDFLRAVETNGSVADGWFFKCRGHVCPHHGRFAPVDREVLDREVSLRWGKGSPPGPLLLVGTQTLEQSLDIDADLLITDLTPSDVLLQRVGRLHRHNRQRPSDYTEARCIVLVPDRSLETALGPRGEVSSTFKRLGYGSVYEDLRSLELTCRFLKQHPRAVIPDDNRLFVEQATHPESLESLAGEKWLEHGNLIYGKGLAKEITASTISNLFDKYFGEIEFIEAGRSVATRLGIDQLHLALDREIVSPFGEKLSKMVIPGHMAPAEPDDGIITVKTGDAGVADLQLKDRCYHYSRYGLEEIL